MIFHLTNFMQDNLVGEIKKKVGYVNWKTCEGQNIIFCNKG